MAEIPHLAYNGDSKIIIRLVETVNALITDGAGTNIEVDNALSGSSGNPVQNAVITDALATLSGRLSAIQETIGVAPGFTASVESDVLTLSGAGAAVKGNHLLLVSDGASVSGGVLYL